MNEVKGQVDLATPVEDKSSNMTNQNDTAQHLTCMGFNVLRETTANVIVACPRVFATCPGHNSSAPTTSVRRHDGSFYCFGCGAQGNGWEGLAALLANCHRGPTP